MTAPINEKKSPAPASIGGINENGANHTNAARRWQGEATGSKRRSSVKPPERLRKPLRPITQAMRREMWDAAECGEDWVHPDEVFNKELADPFDTLLDNIISQYPFLTEAGRDAVDRVLPLMGRVAEQLRAIKRGEVHHG